MGAVSELECSACGWSRATRADDDGWVQTAAGGVLCELCSHDAVNPGSGERGGEGIVLHCPSCGQIQDRAAERVHVEGVGDICPECAARRLRTQRCLECARDISESDCFCFFHEAWWCDECIRSNILECASCRRTTTLHDSIHSSWQHRMPVTAASFARYGPTYCPACAGSAATSENLAAMCSLCGDAHDPDTSVCGSACNDCTNHGVF